MSEFKERKFDTGATRDTDEGKIDFEALLSPLVIQRYGEYMREHTHGEKRSYDNWQAGIPLHEYMKSMWRHFVDLWRFHRGWILLSQKDVDDLCCAVIFNISGYLHERLKMANEIPKSDKPSVAGVTTGSSDENPFVE